MLDRIDFGLKPGDGLALKTTICDDIRQAGEAVVIDYVSTDLVWQTRATPRLYGFESYASFPSYLEDGSLCAEQVEKATANPAEHAAGGRFHRRRRNGRSPCMAAGLDDALDCAGRTSF